MQICKVTRDYIDE